MSRDADYLIRRGWIREGRIDMGYCRAVIWHKDGENDGCQQWEAVQIERLKNPKVRERFDRRRNPRNGN